MLTWPFAYLYNKNVYKRHSKWAEILVFLLDWMAAEGYFEACMIST
jgi:hypothetical protein